MINAARSLHRFFLALGAQNENFHQAYKNLTGYEPGTLEFARPHYEYLCLFRKVLTEIDGLDDEDAAARFRRYAPLWWNYLIRPDYEWGNGNTPANDVVSQISLDMLGSLADIVDRDIPQHQAGPLDELRVKVEEWRIALDDGDWGLAPSLRAQLLSQFKYLLWLIDSADTFGRARVVEEAQNVVGRVITLTPTVRISSQSRWLAALGSLVQAIVLVTGAVDVSSKAIGESADAVHHSVEAVDSAAKAIRDLTDDEDSSKDRENHPTEVNPKNS